MVLALVLAALAFDRTTLKRDRCGCRGKTCPTGENMSTQLIPYAAGPIVDLSDGSAVPVNFAGFTNVLNPVLSYPPDDTLGLASRASWAAPFNMTLTRLTVTYRGLSTTIMSTPVHAEVWVSPACSAPWQITALVTTTLGNVSPTDACTTVTGTVALTRNDKVLLLIRPEGDGVAMVALAVSASISSFGLDY